MKLYLNSIVNQLRNYSDTLDKTSLLIDKPWALIDGDFEVQKLIFKKNKELILSKNGQANIGKWDYFPEAKSLLIDRNSDKILCNEEFIDEGVMILRLDGTEGRFFVLANENIIKDLDAMRYLKWLRYQKLKILERKLVDGRILEVQREDDSKLPQIGNRVTIDAEEVEDGKLQLAKQGRYLEIKNGLISKILYEIRYVTPSGKKLFIQQQDPWRIKRGDYVFVSGRLLVEEVINLTKSKNLIVRNGVVNSLEYKNRMLCWLSKKWEELKECFD